MIDVKDDTDDAADSTYKRIAAFGMSSASAVRDAKSPAAARAQHRSLDDDDDDAPSSTSSTLTSTTTSASLKPLRALCYNVLAECYATSDRHAYCPTQALAWSHRSALVLDTLLAADADVLCLQVAKIA